LICDLDRKCLPVQPDSVPDASCQFSRWQEWMFTQKALEWIAITRPWPKR
jgi:hypothetical protein